MGLSFMSSSCSSYETKPPVLPNPNPKNFKVLRYVHINDHLVIEVRYPDCTNYEGRKIMLYKNTSLKEILDQGSIDPHFCNNPRMKSPFMRAEPTEEGWQVTLKIAGLYL